MAEQSSLRYSYLLDDLDKQSSPGPSTSTVTPKAPSVAAQAAAMLRAAAKNQKRSAVIDYNPRPLDWHLETPGTRRPKNIGDILFNEVLHPFSS